MTRSLRSALDRLAQGGISVHQCVALWRADAPPALAELPPRFGEVLDQLLMRLESSAGFGGASCSFDQQVLLDELALWLDKAEARLARPPTQDRR
ncbi:MAG: hypothetical protein KDG52_19655 [Rhodocyclaceae bacterium]|nr:hypothetical protein [Rhodocyclaceae bacterium]